MFLQIDKSDSTAIMFHMIPSFKLKAEQKPEFIILIDRSRSMDGKSIHLAKQAVAVTWDFLLSDH